MAQGRLWTPTADQRREIEQIAGVGVPHDDIALIIGVEPKTLRKHCKRELMLGKAKANARVGQSLFQQAISGNTAAAIYWTKSQMGWREKHEVAITGADGGPVESSLVVRFVKPVVA